MAKTLTIGSLQIDYSNYKDAAREFSMPYSFFLNSIFDNRQDLLGSICFYDIETDDKENFTLGCVYSSKDNKVATFTDPLVMVEFINSFDIACGFNCYRFDNEVLNKICPDKFRNIGMRNFKLNLFKDTINIDLYPLYNLWKPANKTHRLDQMFIDLNYPREYDLNNKGEKCKEDVLILNEFWPYAKQILDFIFSNFKIGYIDICVVPIGRSSKIRRWFLQTWLIQRGILPRLVRRNSDKKASFFTYAKPGFYKNINVFDVKSAYPNTVINLNSTLYEGGDLAEYMQFMIQQRSDNSDIQLFIKFICNSLIGDMGSNDGLLRDKKIMVKVWNTFKKRMINYVDKVGLDNIIYSYTDCIYTPLNKVRKFPLYDIRLKQKFKWVIIYNVNRLLGETENGIFKTHFTREVGQLKLYEYLNREVDKILKNPKERRKFLLNPKLKVDLKTLEDKYFKIVIRKNSNICTSPAYLDIWSELRYGFNDLFLGKNKIVKDRSKIHYPTYNKYIKNYLKLFKVDKEWLK
jgi:hypothetical protein